MDQYLEEVALRAARRALREHKAECPIADVEQRTRRLELRFAMAVGVMIGSGLLGGLLGGWVNHMLSG